MTPVTAAKVKYGVWGLIGGAIIAMIIGFVWGGCKHGQSILYTSAEIIDCIPQRGGGPLRCLHKFEEPQLLHGNGSLPQALRGLGAIDDPGFLWRQRNQCALW